MGEEEVTLREKKKNGDREDASKGNCTGAVKLVQTFTQTPTSQS